MDDHQFREDLRAHVKANSRNKGVVLTCSEIRKWVGGRLSLEEVDWFSERTVSRWLHVLGFKVQVLKKSLYVDGHEREDVVRAREKYMVDYKEVQKQCYQINDADDALPELPNANATHVIVSQDEKVFHSNDLNPRYYAAQ